MSLATLLYPPPTKRGLDEWSYANLDHHRALTAAIRRQKDIDVQEAPIYPMRAQNFTEWLRQHQQWHDSINQALGVAGVDLQNVDFEDKQQRDAWIWLHFNLHRNCAEALGLGV